MSKNCKHEEVVKRVFTTFEYYMCKDCKAEVTEDGKLIAPFKSEKKASELPKGFRHLLRKEGFKEPEQNKRIEKSEKSGEAQKDYSGFWGFGGAIENYEDDFWDFID